MALPFIVSRDTQEIARDVYKQEQIGKQFDLKVADLKKRTEKEAENARNNSSIYDQDGKISTDLMNDTNKLDSELSSFSVALADTRARLEVHSATFYTALNFGYFGAVLFILGSIFWYYNFQRYQDIILKRQALSDSPKSLMQDPIERL